MTDIVDKETRSKMMRGIRSKNTKPELLLRSALHRLGYRYSLHTNLTLGRPDLWLRKHNAAIFVHGCFWHRHEGCKFTTFPKTRKAFWEQKFTRTMERDTAVLSTLREAGIRTVVVWECALKERGGDAIAHLISDWLATDANSTEFP